MPVFHDGDARRVHGDQGSLARHRRQGAVLDRHRRRLPGRNDLPRHTSVRRRRAGRRRVPDGAREQPCAEDGRRRYQRRGGRRAHGRERRARRRLALRHRARSGRRWRGCTTTARRSCALTSSNCPTAYSSAAAKWIATGSPRIRCLSRSSWRSRDPPSGSISPAPLTHRRVRSTARSRQRCRPAVSRSRCLPAMARRRTRATSVRSRSSLDRARCSTRCRRRPAFSTDGRRCRRSRLSTRRSHRRCRPPSRPAAVATSARWFGGATARRPASRGPTVRRIRSGQGAHAHGDGANSLLHIAESATRFSPVEVWETKNPWLLEQVELIQDSGGPGRNRGGLGVQMDFSDARGRAT